MSERVLIAEFPGDVAAMAAARRPGDRWLAVTPMAMHELELAGESFQLDGDVVDPEALNRIGRENFSVVEALAEAYDRDVTARCPVLAEAGVRPFRDHFRFIKFLADALTTRLAILHRLREDGVGAWCKVRGARRGPADSHDLFYDARASVYEEALELLAAQAGAQVTWLPSADSAPAAPDPSRRTWPRAAGRLRDWVWQRRLAERAGGPCLLTLSTGYELQAVLRMPWACRRMVGWLDLSSLELRCARSGVRWRVDGGKIAPADWRHVVQGVVVGAPGDAAEALCRRQGISYAAPVRGALQRYFTEEVPQALAARSLVDAVHRQVGVAALISATGPSNAAARAVSTYCERERIPVTVVQHGGYGYTDNPVTAYHEFGFTGDYLSWGPGVEAHCGRTQRGRVRFQAVGAPSLDRIVSRRSRTARRRTRVMYVITDLRGASAYFPGGQAYLDTAYYRLQQQVLTVLARHQDRYDLALKMHPLSERNRLAGHMVAAWLCRHGWRGDVEDRPLLEVVEQPALFVVDFPSTTLLQCVATRAEVIVLSGAPHFRLLPEARELLQRRAACCETPAAFLQAVEEVLQRGPVPVDDPDDAFLHHYGTTEPDGGSLPRITAHLERLAAR